MPSTPSPLRPSRRTWLTTSAAAAAGLTLTGRMSPALAVVACVPPELSRSPLARLDLVDRETGLVAPVHYKDGRAWVPGRPGARYALRVRNLTGARVLVVLSVDGVNVISGQTADWRQTGYVLDPGRSYDITGWRKSDSQVAAFEFAPVERSYAAQTGRPGNVGVIGMAVFSERVQAPASPAPEVGALSERRSAEAAGSLPPAPSAAAAAQPTAPSALAGRSAEADNASGARDEAAAKSRLGTGHGQREWSVTRHTAFERAGCSPNQVTQLEYDSLERLVAAGIVPGRMDGPQRPPRPFPANTAGYVPDPPRY